MFSPNDVIGWQEIGLIFGKSYIFGYDKIGIEYEQIVKDQSISPKINDVHTTVLSKNEGIYKLELDFTVDPLANPFFFWRSSGGIFSYASDDLSSVIFISNIPHGQAKVSVGMGVVWAMWIIIEILHWETSTSLTAASDNNLLGDVMLILYDHIALCYYLDKT